MSKAQTSAPQQQNNPLLAEVSKVLTDVLNAPGEKKSGIRGATVTDVKEYQFTGEDKKTATAVVVYLPYIFVRDNKQLIPKLVNEIQKRRNQHAFIVAKRTTINKKAAFTQRIPRNRTLTAVYDSILDDLIAPAQVIGKRIRYRLNGSQLIKIFLNEESRAFLENKTHLIAQLYFALTNRKIAFEFRPEPSFIQLPKAKTPAKKQAAPKPKA